MDWVSVWKHFLPVRGTERMGNSTGETGEGDERRRDGRRDF